MKNTSERKVLHIDRVNPSPLWNFKQEDDGVLLLTLYKGGQALDVTGQTITLGVKNSKGQLIEHKTGITISGSNVDIVLSNSIFAVKGKLECDLILKDSQGQMSSATFYLLVGQKVLGEDNILSTNIVPTIDKIANDFEARGNKLIDDVTKDYCTLQKVIIDENASANLQNQINDVNSSLESITQINITKYKDLVIDNNWSNAIEQALLDSNTGELYFPKNDNDYLVDRTIVLGRYNAIKIDKGATIKAIKEMNNVIEKHNGATDNNSGYTVSPYNSICGGGTINCDLMANGVSLGGYRHFVFKDVKILNPKTIGVDTRFRANAFAVELIADNIYIESETGKSKPNTIGLNVKNTDGHFNNIICVNMGVGIQNEQGGNKYSKCHVWNYDLNTINNTIGFVDWADGVFTDCFADTCKTGWSLQGNSTLVNPYVYTSSEFPISTECEGFLIPLGDYRLNRIYNATVTGTQESPISYAIKGEINKNVDIKNIYCNEYVLAGIPQKESYYISKEFKGGSNCYNFSTIRIPKKSSSGVISGKFLIMPNTGNDSTVASENLELDFWIKTFVKTNDYTASNTNVRVKNKHSYLDGKIKVSKTDNGDYVDINFYYVMPGSWGVVNFNVTELMGGHGGYQYSSKNWVQTADDNINTLVLMHEDKDFVDSVNGTEISVLSSRNYINDLYLNGHNIWVDSNSVPRIINGDKTGDSVGQPLLRYTMAPASSNSNGSVGMLAFDGSYLYICIATNTWRRISLTSW